MDAPHESRDQVGTKARVLILSADGARGADLARYFPCEKYDVISCPVSVPTAGWLPALDPHLLLLAPPSRYKEFFETCEVIRRQTERPIAVLSERNGENLVARTLAAGIDEYLVEPMGARELVARIEALLRRTYAGSGPWEVERTGRLLLSASDHSANISGRKVSLSPTEFRLLACLASVPDMVFTHRTLMSRVWGAEYVDSRHYLRVYIRHLREKVEHDPNHPQIILNEWGMGYRFRPPCDVSAS